MIAEHGRLGDRVDGHCLRGSNKHESPAGSKCGPDFISKSAKAEQRAIVFSHLIVALDFVRAAQPTSFLSHVNASLALLQRLLNFFSVCLWPRCSETARAEVHQRSPLAALLRVCFINR